MNVFSWARFIAVLAKEFVQMRPIGSPLP